MKLGRLLHIILASAVLLFIACHLMLNSRSMQQKAAESANRIATSALNTNVSVSSVRFMYPFGIEIGGMTIFDQQNDTLVHILRTALFFKPAELIHKKLSISGIRLSRPDFRLRIDTVSGKPNYAFLQDTFAGNSNGSSGLSLRANSINIHNGKFRFDNDSIQSTPGRFNPGHIGVDGLIANIAVKALSSDSISLFVRKLTARESSGFVLTSARGAIEAGSDLVSIGGFRLSTPNSRLELTALMTGRPASDSIRTIPSLTAKISARLTGQDFQAFVPGASSMSQPVKLSADVRSNRDSLFVNRLDVGLWGKSLVFETSGQALLDSVANLLDFKGNISGKFQKDLPKIINSQLSGFNVSVPAQLWGLGNGTFVANCSRQQKNIGGMLKLNSDAGSVNLSLSEIDGYFSAKADARQIALGKITGNRQIGNCSFSALAKARLDGNSYYGSSTINIGHATLFGYDYRDIAVYSDFDRKSAAVLVNFSDKNGDLNLHAEYSADSVPYYMTSLSLKDVKLASYSCGRLDSLTVSTRILASAHGHDIDDVNGRLTVDSLKISRPGFEDWSMGNLTACMANTGGDSRMASVFSDFLNASMVGDFSFRTLAKSAVNALDRILPSVGNAISDRMGLKKSSTKAENSLAFNAGIDNLDIIGILTGNPIQVAGQTSVNIQLCDRDSTMAGKIVLPRIAFNGRTICDTDIELGICGDSVSVTANGIQSHDGRSIMAQIKVNSPLLENNALFTDFTITDLDAGSSLPVQARLEFAPYNRKTGLSFGISLNPSVINYSSQLWRLSMDTLSYCEDNIMVRNFRLDNRDQYLTADGVISKDSASVLGICLNNVDIDRMLSSVGSNGWQFKGIASGQIDIAGILGKPAFTGQVDIGGFSFATSYQGDLSAQFNWNGQMSQIDISGTATDSTLQTPAVTVINGFYRPGNSLVDITVDATHTDLHFINRWTSDVFDELGGRGTGRLRIFSDSIGYDMEGCAVLENGFFKQGDTGATYLTKSDTLRFEPGKMLFSQISLFDEYGHDGLMDCYLYHDHFHNWKVDMNATVSDMLVYNVPKTDNGSIWSKVFADGDVTLTYSAPDGLAVKVNAMTSGGTRFGYRHTDSSLERYNFLTIVDRDSLIEVLNTDKPVQIQNVEKESSTRFNLDINVACNDNAMLDLAFGSLNGSFRGNGNISVKYSSKDGLMMNGMYNLSYGTCSLSIEDLIRKDFTLRDGSFVRFNGAPENTQLNLLTCHNVNYVSIYDLDPTVESNNNVRVRCLLDITGSVEDPQLDFGVDMPYGTSQEKDILASAIATEEQRNIQFMYLMTIGCFYSFDSNQSLSDMLTPTYMESLVNSTVSGQVNNLLSQILDSDHITLSSNLSASNYLTNDATNLSNKELEGILEAHLLDNRLLINGNFGYRENTINQTSNFIGDVEMRYLLFPRKGVSIKGYSKSNDKYFSKTTLTTQGIGLVFEKDF